MTARVKPWQVLARSITYRDRWLTVRTDRCVTGDGREVPPYHVIEYPDWINVVALTRDEQRLVLVREYRHGRGEVLLGLVSGTVEALDGEDADKAAEAAARRELTEETGFRAGRMLRLLDAYPNPATQNNRVTSFLAFDLESSGFPSLDPTEEIEVVIDDFEAVLARLLNGELEMQAMHVAALWQAAARITRGDGIPESTATLQKRLRAAFA